MNTPNADRKIFFSSDFHFNHTNISGPKMSKWSSGYRNFESVEEMNKTIIDNLNSTIGENDILYFLGDFAFGDKSKIPSLREKIKCQTIHFVYGNHDECIRKNRDYRHLFASTGDLINNYFGKQQIIMSHFPMDVWENNARDSIALFAHCHGNFKNPLGKRMDVGVDTNKFFPYTLEEVIEFCKAKAPFLPDHHR